MAKHQQILLAYGSIAIVAVTWDPATVTAATLSGGNLVATSTGTTSADQGVRVASASGKTTGKYYFEILAAQPGGGGNVGFGVGTTASTYTNMGNSATTGLEVYSSGNIWSNGSASGSSVGSSFSTSVPMRCAIDLDNRKGWFKKDVAFDWNGTVGADPVTNTSGILIPAGTMVPLITFGGSSGASGTIFTANFGASAFTGAVPSGFTAGWPV